MKHTITQYFCDGCGKQSATEREVEICEEKHRGMKLVFFIIGNEKLPDWAGSLEGITDCLSIQKWIPVTNLIYKIPCYLDGKTKIFLFEFQGETTTTHLKQKFIQIFRCKHIEEDLAALLTNY